MPPRKDCITSLQLRLREENQKQHWNYTKKATKQKQVKQRKIDFRSKLFAIYQDSHDSDGVDVVDDDAVLLHSHVTSGWSSSHSHVFMFPCLCISHMLRKAWPGQLRWRHWTTNYLFTFDFNLPSDKLNQLFCNNHIHMSPSPEQGT